MILLIYIIGFVSHYILVLLMTAFVFKFNPEYFDEQGVNIHSTSWAFQVFIDGLIWPITWGNTVIQIIKKL
jgi:hypothetical protein